MNENISHRYVSLEVLIVHEDRLYDLMFIPWDESDANFKAIETLCTTVIVSFAFMP